jgi:hypothetical protein
MNIQALLSAAQASDMPPVPKTERDAPPTSYHGTTAAAFDENRGTKRKLSGWTAPSTHVVPPLRVAEEEEPEAAVQVKSEEPRVKSEESSLPEPSSSSSFARLGTRVPGSGDLGNTGAAERTWPSLPGVSVGQPTEEGDLIAEEECYSWTDLPMNKQGMSRPRFPSTMV